MFGGYDYDDHDFYHESSGNMLVDHYHATNLAHGHERGCGYGAGADCTCKAGEFLAFVVRVRYGSQWIK